MKNKLMKLKQALNVKLFSWTTDPFHIAKIFSAPKIVLVTNIEHSII